MLTYPHINPIAVSIGPIFGFGPLQVHWYGIMYLIGFVGAWWLARYRARRPGSTWVSLEIDDLIFYCAIGVIVGGRLGNVLFYDPGYYFAHPIEILKVWEGGMAFHGGLIGAALGVALFARRYHTPLLTVCDLASLAAPIGIFLGRLANFIKPELWGRPTDVPWAIIFPGSDGLPRHPSQIYESVFEGLAVFIVLSLVARWGALRRPGLVAGLFGALYGVARIGCEFFRDPDPRLEDLGNGLTMGMVLSTPLILVGLALIAWSLRGRAARPA